MTGKRVKKTGYLLAMIGLLLGMALGFGVLILQNYLERELVGLLEDESQQACDSCHFKVDSISISLLGLSAKAVNPRIELDGQPKVRFESLTVKFSLSQIRDRLILITDLNLDSGSVDGVLADSVLYRFIDQLVTPSQPERASDPPVRVKLLKLSITDSKATQQVSGSSLEDGRALEGSGISVLLTRMPSDRFELSGSIGDLTLISNPGYNNRERVQLGSLTTQIQFLEHQTLFKSLDLKLAESHFKFAGALDDDGPIQGNLELLFDSVGTIMSHLIDTGIVGVGQVHGTVDAPIVESRFSLLPGRSTRILSTELPFGEINYLDTALTLKLSTAGEPHLTVPEFNVASPVSRLSLLDPILLTPQTLSGRAQFVFEQLTVGGVEIRGGDIEFTVAGSVDDPSISWNGDLAAVILGGTREIAPVKTSGIYIQRELAATISSSPQTGGDLRVNLKIDSGVASTLSQLDAVLAVAAFPVTPEASLLLDGWFEVSGPLALNSLVGRGDIFIGQESVSLLSGKVELQESRLRANLATESNRARIFSELDLGNSSSGNIQLELDQFSFADIDPDATCSSLTGKADYSFSLQSPDRGIGRVAIEDFLIGCAPYVLSLSDGIVLPINNGELELADITLYQSSDISGRSSTVKIGGRLSLADGYDLSLGGQIYLQSLVGFARGIDDLFGVAELDLSIGGLLVAPEIRGYLNLKDGAVFVESSGIELRDLQGRVSAHGDRLEFTGFSGQINHGDFILSGSINLADLAASNFSLTLQRGFFEPLDTATVEVSAALQLIARGGLPFLVGTVTIDSAEFSRDLDLRFIIRLILQRTLFRRRPESPVLAGGKLPEVGLDVHITSPGNVQFATNLAVADLAVDLRISGTSNQPITTGDIRSVSGWFRVNARRLEITSGTIQFRQGAAEPQINLVGETNVSSFHGQSSLIIVEVRGPISSPVITFNSDLGLSQREIVDLLAHQGGVSDLTTFGSNRTSLLAALEDPDRSIFDENLFTFIPRILRELARFDSLSVEPTYSPARGAIVPNLIAARKITSRLDLRGESAMFGAGGSASFGLFYQLRRGLTAVGKVESLPDQDTTALGADLVYSAYGMFRPFMQIEVVGNDTVDELTVLGGARIRESSRLTKEDVFSIGSRVERFYRNRGFFQATAAAECLEFDGHCRSLKIVVQEGTRSIAVAFRPVLASDQASGDAQSAIDIVERELSELPRGRQATAGLLERTRRVVVRGLRNEGFIAARVEVQYTEFKKEIDGELTRAQSRRRDAGDFHVLSVEVRVSPGSPISFVFEGNQAFTPEQLLETINLFGRRQPFGSNTVNILVNNIQRLYRARGYFEAQIESERQIDPESGRVLFNIKINEGRRVRLGGINFEFKDLPADFTGQVSSADVREKIEEVIPKSDRAIWTQAEFDQSGLAESSRFVSQALVELGFPNNQTTFEFEIAEQGEVPTAQVTYHVELGQRIVVNKLQIDGLPRDFEMHSLPTEPLFVPQLNREMGSILSRLRKAGWVAASVESVVELDNDNNGKVIRTVLLKFRNGEPTLIGSISVEGLEEISSQVIMQRIRFAQGEQWDQDSIDATRRALLRLGLFSQVQIEPASGVLASGEQDMVIRVSERPLQTLEVGAGVQSEFGIHLFTQATDRSLFGDGRSLSLRLDGYYDPSAQEIPFGVAGLQYVTPGAFGSEFSFISDLRYQKVDLSTQEYDLDRVSLASYFSKSRTVPWTVSFGHSILADDLNDVTPGAIISPLDEGSVITSFLSGSVGYDRRNNRLNPTSGYFLGFDTKLATELIGSDSNYYELGARAAYIHPFTLSENNFSVAAHSRVISAWVLGDTEEVPITQRLYLGGRTTVRGFRENSLGPRGEDGAVIGGDLSLLGNLEFRYHPMEIVQLFTFFDAGTVYLQQDEVDLDEIRYSAGFGSRYLSPIGPIGFDLGFPLDERSGEPSTRFSFTIGTQF